MSHPQPAKVYECEECGQEECECCAHEEHEHGICSDCGEEVSNRLVGMAEDAWEGDR